MGGLRNPFKQVTAGIQVGNRKHPLSIMGNPVLHLLRHLVHMDPLSHRLTGKLAQRGRGDRGIRFRAIGAHIDILNDLRLPCERLANALRPFDEEPPRLLTVLSVGELGYAADTFRLGVREYLLIYGHTASVARGAHFQKAPTKLTGRCQRVCHSSQPAPDTLWANAHHSDICIRRAIFIVHNAIRNLWRNKGRSVLIIIVVTIIAAASTIGFAIVQAAQRARASALENTTISAQISLDRNKIMQSANSSGQKPDMSSFGKAMQEKQLTLDDYEQYAKSEYGVSSSYYIETSSAAAVDGGIEAVDTNNGSSQESSDNANSRTDTGTAGAETEGAMPNDMPRDMGGQNGGPAMTTGDFSLVGFSSDEALENAPNGSFTMDSGKAFDYDASDGTPVLVSKTLADANNLKVGSTFKLANVSDSKKTYTFTVAGIYSNTQESNMPMGGTMASIANDAANAIYMSAATLGKIDLDSTKTLSITDSKGNTRETSATQLSFTYVFDGKTDYDRFTEEVKKAGLLDDCTVSSMDVEQYEQSLVPIDNLSKFAKTMLIVVLSVSAVVLVILTIFNIRERKYEIGVLTAIGVKKWKVSAQFAVELLTVVLIGLIVGTGIGASTSVPVSDALLSSQVASQQSQQESRRAQFGRDMQGAPGAAPDGNAQSAKPNTDNIQGESAEPNDGKQSQSGMPQGLQHASNAIKQVNATVSWATIGWMLLIGLALTLLASVTAAIFVMRYEPLQILADRS